MFILSTWHSAGNQTFITKREEMFHSAVTFVSFWKGNLSVDLSRTGSNEPPLTKKNGVSSKRTFRCRPAFYYSITPFRLLSTLTIVTISSWIMNSNRVHTARSDDTRRRGYVVVRGRQINWLEKRKENNSLTTWLDGSLRRNCPFSPFYVVAMRVFFTLRSGTGLSRSFDRPSAIRVWRNCTIMAVWLHT